MLLWLQTQTAFVVLEESLEVYNNHELNHVHKLDPKQFQRALEELSRYYEFIRPLLQPIYTIPFRFPVNSNPKIEDFNEWRAKYPKLTYQENLVYHKRWAIEYPDQQHFYTGLDVIKQCTTLCKSIMEIGGWTGDLAGIILKEKTNIQRWDNYDLIEPPSHCPDSRYSTHIRENWLWKTDSLTQQYDVLVASNVLEHMTYEEVHSLFNWLPKIPIVVVVLPFLQRNWHNYHGAHIYRGMIDHFIAQIESHGYNLQYHQTRITREEVLVFSLDPLLVPKQPTPEEKDRELWKKWRLEEGCKTPHLKFQEWKKHQ
jgi:hypothetical protein